MNIDLWVNSESVRGLYFMESIILTVSFPMSLGFRTWFPSHPYYMNLEKTQACFQYYLPL